jgi:hypothetical protein
MSHESLQAIVGTAILDKQFLHDLLNSRREQAISRFELTPEERRVLRAIRAETIEQFAYQLDDWIVGQEKKAFTARIPSAFRYIYDPAPLLV